MVSRAEEVKYIAEADQAHAAAENARAEARRTNAEAARLEVEARNAELTERLKLATDEHNQVYRYNDDISYASVEKCIDQISKWHRLSPGCPIEIVFNSEGGDISAGMSLFDFLRRMSAEGHEITTGCEGMAASTAGVLLQTGDRRWMGKQSWLLIHRSSFHVGGSTYEVEDELKTIRRAEARIIDIFKNRTGGKLTGAKIRANWRRADWWIESEDCLKLGLVDELKGDK